jgi:hypothetical protein
MHISKKEGTPIYVEHIYVHKAGTMIDKQLLKKIESKLQKNYFAIEGPEAYKKTINILHSIDTRHDLNEHLNKCFERDWILWNLLAASNRLLTRAEPILHTVGEKVNVPSKVYKEGYEPAIVKAINYDDYAVLVQPLRVNSEILWCSIDLAKRIKGLEKIVEVVEAEVNKYTQLSLF